MSRKGHQGAGKVEDLQKKVVKIRSKLHDFDEKVDCFFLAPPYFGKWPTRFVRKHGCRGSVVEEIGLQFDGIDSPGVDIPNKAADIAPPHLCEQCAVLLHLLVMSAMRCAELVIDDDRFAIAFHHTVGTLRHFALAQNVSFAV